jgi:hypothetical protein
LPEDAYLHGHRYLTVLTAAPNKRYNCQGDPISQVHELVIWQ